MPRKQRFNILLLKEEVLDGSDALKDTQQALALNAFPLKDELPFTGTLYLKNTAPRPPAWQRFIEEGTAERLAGLFNQSSSALLVLESDNRLFCVSYGHARHWIDDDKIERRFGLIVTLNSVEKIRSVDIQQIDTITRSTRTQTSRYAELENFGLDVRRDLMRSVTGEPDDQAFASQLTGADNLILCAAVSFHELGAKCSEALRRYRLLNYRERYPWIDHLRQVRDPIVTRRLDDALSESLRGGNLDKLFLAPPRVIDPQLHEGFRFTNEARDAPHRPDIDIESFLSLVPDKEQLSVESLKRKYKVEHFHTDRQAFVDRFSVYDAIVFETEAAGAVYSLTCGEWFEIEGGYAQEVEREIRGLPHAHEIDLPSAVPGEHERDYNARAARDSAGYLLLLDRRPVRYGGGRSSIEVCDLLSRDRHFIHVKPKTVSATLSHLFAQGLNSAQAFRDPVFREAVIALPCDPSHEEIFSNPEPDPREHTVVYAIITDSDRELAEALPFFSKQSLANAARELRNSGFRIKLKKVPLRAGAAPEGEAEAAAEA